MPVAQRAAGGGLEEGRRQYLGQPLRLVDFRIERSGNGRDFDIVPAFTGGHAGAYALRFDVLAPGGTPRRSTRPT